MSEPGAASPGTTATAPPLPDFAKWGPVERTRLNKLARTAVSRLTAAWQLVPHVTQHELADVTELETGRRRLMQSRREPEPKITMAALVLRACATALKEFPNANASFDAVSGELILKQYYHIGVAVDTEHGLIVPVIRDVDQKGIKTLARELTELADKARGRKLTLEEMQGGTFTVTNLGGIGGTAFTPIVNYPEVAILGLSRTQQQPVLRDGNLENRMMLPLSLSYDHRVINGADGIRFLSRIAQLLSDPVRLLVES